MHVKKIITELITKHISKETLAGKMGISTRTIERWSAGETSPNFIEERYLIKVFAGYKSKK